MLTETFRLKFKALAHCGLHSTSPFAVYGFYTGPIDNDFLPHGEGTFTTQLQDVDTSEWVHGCPQNKKQGESLLIDIYIIK